jgi:carboxypeptidase T
MSSMARWFCFAILGLTWFTTPAQENYHLLRAPHTSLIPLFDELSIDHFRPATGDSIDWVASEYERLLLEKHHIAYRLLQPNLSNWFQRQASQSLQPRTNCDLAHYASGSMGGYHTYSEILAELDSMHSLFPHLITAPYSIGQSFEGREIWAVKLSDQPGQNQSANEERVYFDALTHAREPLGMESLLYFLWWLLENYGQDATATYLLDQREIFAVPVVNPDGYLYNEQIAPQGGGLWRKNRRPHNNTCVGVDLNRNFSNGWGIGVGASTDPCSDTYQGSAAFSEPEIQAVRQMIDTLGAASGFSLHSFGPSFLQPLGFQLQGSDHALYAELASEFVPHRSRGYGIPEHMLNYLIAGSTMDYLYAKNTLSWSPEVGSMFWEPAGAICGLVQEMLFPMQYLCWIAGAYARIHDVGFNPAMQDDTLGLSFRLVNRGLNGTARQVQLKARSLSPHLITIDSISTAADIPARQIRAWSTFPLRFYVGSGANPDEPMGIALQVLQEGVLTDSDTVFFLGGLVNNIFQEDF